MMLGAANINSSGNQGKVNILHFVPYVEVILVLEEVGRMILVSTTLLKHTRNMWRRKQNRES